MIAPRQALSNRFGGAILKDEATIVAKHCISDGGFNAHARRPSRKNQAVDGAVSKNLVQIRFVEPAVSVLIENHIRGLGLQLGNDVGVPCVANQEPSLPTIRSSARLADSEMEMTFSVRRVGVSKIRQIRPEAHL